MWLSSEYILGTLNDPKRHYDSHVTLKLPLPTPRRENSHRPSSAYQYSDKAPRLSGQNFLTCGSGVPYIFCRDGKVPTRRDKKYKGRLIAG